MSSAQFGFLVAFLAAWMWAETGFLTALAAVVAGLVGYFAVRVVDGSVDLGEFSDRFTGSRR